MINHHNNITYDKGTPLVSWPKARALRESLVLSQVNILNIWYNHIDKEAINASTFTEEEGGEEDWVCFRESWPTLNWHDYLTSVMCTCKYCKSCDAGSGHSLTVSYKPSMSWIEFLNLRGIVSCACPNEICLFTLHIVMAAGVGGEKFFFWPKDA